MLSQLLSKSFKPHLRRLFSAQITEYDVCILGCGSAGFSAAVRGWDYGKNVAIISPDPVGGATINNGALSSKVLWQLSRQARHTKELSSNFSPSFKDIKSRVSESCSVKQCHYLYQMNNLNSNTRYSNDEDGGGGNIRLYNGYGKLIDNNTIEITSKKHKNKELIKSKYVIIATGSIPRIHSSFPTDHKYIINSNDIPNNLETFPESILIFGGGVIGLEYSTIFSNFGVTKNIYVFNEFRQRLLPQEDKDLSEFITYNLSNSNVNILNNVKMLDIKIDNKRNKVKCIYQIIKQKNPNIPIKEEYSVIETKELIVDKILMAIGRVPNIQNLGLKKEYILDNGYVNSNNQLCINNKDGNNIYCVGDSLGKGGLVNIAEMEGRHCMERIFGIKNPTTSLNYNSISSIMFLRPEVSAIGINEIEAQKRNISYKVCLLRLGLINRCIIDWNLRHTSKIEPKKVGFVKMLITDDDHKILLGVRALGVDSSNLIQSCAYIINQKMSVRELDKINYPHPSIVECVKECSRMLLGKSIYKSHVWPRSYVKHWSPGIGSSYAEEINDMFKSNVPGYMEQ